MSTKKKFYAVKVGRVPGIYTTWEECQQQIKGFSGALYGGFFTLEEAEAYLQEAEESGKAPLQIPEGKHYDIFTGCSFKEGSFFSDVRYSSAFVAYEADKLIHIGKAEGKDKEAVTENHGITGEIEAVTNAVIWAEGQGVPSITIHYSFTGIAHWASGDWPTNNKLSQEYAEFIKAREGWVKFIKVDTHSEKEKHDKAKKHAREILVK